MLLSDEIRNLLAMSRQNEDFIVGEDNFSEVQINSVPARENFFYFFNTKKNHLIKQFVLKKGKQVDYLCQITLIKKGEKFTPRLSLSVRNKSKEISEEVIDLQTNIKANVSLEECHENFWKLVSFLQSLQDVEIPQEHFSLITKDEGEIINALKGRDVASIINIIKQLSNTQGIKLSQEDINQLLKRRETLEKFQRGVEQKISDEGKWQTFFEQNKWIFGYGLDYQILRQEQAQPHYGGGRIDGKGGQRGDYLTATDGDLSFTVLVEIKTPATPLLQGSEEIRNGAWSLSKHLTDAVSQIEANIDKWEREGAKQIDNQDRLESENVFTVKPKGIIVIGSLSELQERSKWETLQRFRKSIHGIDIITFDELCKRAKFITELG